MIDSEQQGLRRLSGGNSNDRGFFPAISRRVGASLEQSTHAMIVSLPPESSDCIRAEGFSTLSLNVALSVKAFSDC
jgi:hypothetical protein